MSKNMSVAQVLVIRVGMLKASRVISFMSMYGAVCLDRQERVSMEDFAEAWGYSTAHAYRALRLFRDAIPEFDHPYDLVEAVMEGRAGAFGSLGPMWGAA